MIERRAIPRGVLPPDVPFVIRIAAVAEQAKLEASLALPRVSEVGLLAAVQATLEFAQGLRARVEAESVGEL